MLEGGREGMPTTPDAWCNGGQSLEGKRRERAFPGNDGVKFRGQAPKRPYGLGTKSVGEMSFRVRVA
jgi:hypothetical protein